MSSIEIRPSSSERAALTERAWRAGQTYRAYLEALLTQAVAEGYQPEVIQPTRVEIPEVLRDALTEAAQACRRTPKEFINAVLARALAAPLP